MRLIDAHAHLDAHAMKGLTENYADWLSGILARAKEKQVKAIVANGTNPESNRQVQTLAQEHDLIKPALGFYPTEVEKISEEFLDEELEYIKKQKDKIVAIGEVGLDKKYSEGLLTSGKWKELYAKQQAGFEKIISLSEKTKKPLLLHTRKAEQDVVDMLESSSLKNPMMHCFTGKKKLVKTIADHGWNFSVPVTVLKLHQFQELVKEVPLNQLLTETDTPFLGPESGPTNEPANISLSVMKMAELKGITKEEMSDQIFLNYMRLFN
ncbi:MAG: TatD family hydrolase [Nanoarchaeota archaeon]|nr:TatD family hydrolase [Nanoarchaeota archaeon]